MVRLTALAAMAVLALAGPADGQLTPSDSRFSLEPAMVTSDKDQNPITVGGEVRLTMWIDLQVDEAEGESVRGFELSVCHNQDELELDGTLENGFWEEGGLFEIIRGRREDPLIYNEVYLRDSDTEGHGLTQAIIFDIGIGGDPFAFTSDEGFSNITLAYRPKKPGVCTELNFDGAGTGPYECNPLGPAPSETFLVVDKSIEGVTWSLGFRPHLEGAKISLGGGCVPFLRGDCQADGRMRLGDMIALLLRLFAPPAQQLEVDREDACDWDDDGKLRLGDAISGLKYLFDPDRSPGPAPPFPDCGLDPTADELASRGYDEELCR